MSTTHDLESLLKKLDHKDKKEIKKLQASINTLWHKAYKLNSHKTNIKEIKKMYHSINDVKKIIDAHLD